MHSIKLSIFFALLLFVAPAWGNEEKVKDEPKEKWDEYLGPIIYNLLGKKQDSSIHFIEDQGDALIVVFNELPGSPPYRIETRRLVQEDPNEYSHALEQEMILNEVRSDGLETNFGIAMPRQNYLPGERVTWRIFSQQGEILKEVICCPNPVVVKDSLGETIMEVALISLFKPTAYALVFPSRKEKIELIFTVGKKQFKGMIPAGELKITTFEPVLEGVFGGMSTIELSSNKKSYNVKLPWGNEIVSILSHVEKTNSLLGFPN